MNCSNAGLVISGANWFYRKLFGGIANCYKYCVIDD